MRSPASRWFLCLLLCRHTAVAQSEHVTFAIATVKQAPGADPNTGSWSPPGTGKFTATHISLAMLLQLAYGVDKSQIANAPRWLETDLYDVAAKPEDGVTLTRDELKPRLQNLLQQRFHLVAHTETRPSRGYALAIAKGGQHLTPTKAEHFPGYRINVSPGEMRGINWSMPTFAKYLSSIAGFPVVDRTDLTGNYDIAFSFASNEETDKDLPSLNQAIQQATGLILKPQMVPVETVVIDSVNKVPTDN